MNYLYPSRVSEKLHFPACEFAFLFVDNGSFMARTRLFKIHCVVRKYVAAISELFCIYLGDLNTSFIPKLWVRKCHIENWASIINLFDLKYHTEGS